MLTGARNTCQARGHRTISNDQPTPLIASTPLQVGFAFRRIEMALNYLVDNLPQLSGLAAETERLDVLLAGKYPLA